MKRGIFKIALFLSLSAITTSSFASNYSAPKDGYVAHVNIPVLSLQTPNLKAIHEEDAINDANHYMYRFAVATQVNITTENTGVWFTQPNGDRVWQLEVSYPGAAGLSFLFERFIVHGNTTFDAFSKEGKKLHTTFDASEVLEHGRQNMELCAGSNMILQLVEPKGTTPSEIYINTIHFAYRGLNNPTIEKINESAPCEVNANCTPEGDEYLEEMRGVVRVYVVETGSAGWCSGAVVNNAAGDCKPYVLTALHCGVNSTTANFNQFKFYFGYEAPGCTNPTTIGTLASHSVTGCVKLANSNDGGGNSGSDFLLVQMGTLATEAATIAKIKGPNYKAFWNGWDATTTASTGGVSIHHPAGDIKKISTYTAALTSTGWGISGTHWRVKWAATTNGHGVTEGGSSGSPLFTFNGGNSRIVGTLTGGSSYCTSPTSPDAYGKMSYHWTSNGTPANEQLKTYLDPNNTGVLVFDGSWDPCNGSIGMEEKQVLEGIKIYPNPASSIITIDLSALSSEAAIRIYDLSGKLLIERNNLGSSVNELNISGLTNGMYQVVVESAAGQITRKITKM
jgi:lysyl endopeptidase